ncbi:hypothetical protein D1614_11110 [Maribellus luteus]|uniref:DUF6249 domain-containing protein n=2 Tax=Maribellus luteus TaxID=2305463 RepID=A0A399T079_9BACT|nr:hypothetical protein D1614_11110 [Maribellus luteus]
MKKGASKRRKRTKNNLKTNIMEGILIPIGFFLALFAILYVYWTTRTKERLALVEKGMDAGIFKGECSQYALVKWGIFLIALGLGVVAGSLLSMAIEDVVAYFTAILVCGGVGLIVAYLVTSKLMEKKRA